MFPSGFLPKHHHDPNVPSPHLSEIHPDGTKDRSLFPPSEESSKERRESVCWLLYPTKTLVRSLSHTHFFPSFLLFSSLLFPKCSKNTLRSCCDHNASGMNVHPHPPFPVPHGPITTLLSKHAISLSLSS